MLAMRDISICAIGSFYTGHGVSRVIVLDMRGMSICQVRSPLVAIMRVPRVIYWLRCSHVHLGTIALAIGCVLICPSSLLLAAVMRVSSAIVLATCPNSFVHCSSHARSNAVFKCNNEFDLLLSRWTLHCQVW